MPKVQTVGTVFADFWARVQEAWHIIRNGIPKPPADRVTRGAVLVPDDVLNVYATHQSGVKRQMARELLAARSVVMEARSLTANSEVVDCAPYPVTDDAMARWRAARGLTTDAIHNYDLTFAPK